MNNTIFASKSTATHYSAGRNASRTARSEGDAHVGSVEPTPSWLGGGKFLKAFGCIALASVMLVGCTDPNAGHHAQAQNQDPVKQEQVLHPQAQPKAQAQVSACTQLKTLNAQTAPSDPTEAKSFAADKELAQANCQIEIAQKQTEAAEKMAAAQEKAAQAAERQAAAQQRQAEIAKRKEDFERGQRAAEGAMILGGALRDGINGILR